MKYRIKLDRRAIGLPSWSDWLFPNAGVTKEFALDAAGLAEMTATIATAKAVVARLAPAALPLVNAISLVSSS